MTFRGPIKSGGRYVNFDVFVKKFGRVLEEKPLSVSLYIAGSVSLGPGIGLSAKIFGKNLTNT